MRPKSRFLMVISILASSILASAVASAGQNCGAEYQADSRSNYKWGVVDDMIGVGLGLAALPSWGISLFAVGTEGLASAANYHTAYQESKMASLLAEAQAGDGTDLRIAYGQAKADGCPLSFDQFKSWLLTWSSQNKGLCNNGHVTNATVDYVVDAAAKAHSESSTTAATSQTNGSGAEAN